MSMVRAERLTKAKTELTLESIGEEAKDAAWYYPEPKPGKASSLKDHVAFCNYGGLFNRFSIVLTLC